MQPHWSPGSSACSTSPTPISVQPPMSETIGSSSSSSSMRKEKSDYDF